MRAISIAAIMALGVIPSAHAFCGAWTVGGAYNNVPTGPADPSSCPVAGNVGTGMLCNMIPMGALGNYYSFQNTTPIGGGAGEVDYVTSIKFQTKGINYNISGTVSGGPLNGQTLTENSRNSYYVFGSSLGGIGGVNQATYYTVTDRRGEDTFYPPLKLPNGFDFRQGQLINNSIEAQNMIVIVQGFARDNTCAFPQAVEGIPPGY